MQPLSLGHQRFGRRTIVLLALFLLLLVVVFLVLLALLLLTLLALHLAPHTLLAPRFLLLLSPIP